MKRQISRKCKSGFRMWVLPFWWHSEIPQSRILALITAIKQVTLSYTQGWRTVTWGACHSQKSWHSHRAEALQCRGAPFQVCPFENSSPIQESMVTHLSSASFIRLAEADLGEVCRGLRGRVSKMSRKAASAGVSSTRVPCSPLSPKVPDSSHTPEASHWIPGPSRILTGHPG